MERLHTIEETGVFLGNLNANDVRHLIKTGRLEAKKRIARGKNKRPRYVVTASAIEKYIRELPDASDIPREVEKRKNARLPKSLRDELAACRKYV